MGLEDTTMKVSMVTEAATAASKRAATLIQQGHPEDAERIFRQAVLLAREAPQLSNLSAIATALGHRKEALDLASRAASIGRDSAPVMNNLGVASVRARRFRDAELAFRAAIKLDPRLLAPVSNLALIWTMTDHAAQAQGILEAGLRHRPDSWALALQYADVTRSLCQHDVLKARALRALSLLLGHARAATPSPARVGGQPDTRKATEQVMCAIADTLETAGIKFCLIGSTLLAVVRDGGLFAFEKDIDVAVIDGQDPGLVWAMFADHADYARLQQKMVHGPGALQAMGLIHRQTGVAIDILFPRQCGDHWECGMGWPDELVFDVPLQGFGEIQWLGRNWVVPDPLEDYFRLAYGTDWRLQDVTMHGHAMDKRYLDTPLFNRMLRPEAFPRALNMTLMRLAHALVDGNHAQAQSLSWQILECELLVEVSRIEHALQRAPAP